MSVGQSPQPSSWIGRELGHFRVLSRLGEGGMGVVYRAMDERLQRTVALKVLPEDAMGDEARRRRFLREARSAAAVVHANVASVYEADQVDGCVYIAMELVVGTTLRAELARGRLPVGEALRIARGIARALAKAHEKGIVHRDLKPDNVMLNEDREVKVLDFGLAKIVGDAAGGDAGAIDETASHDSAHLVGTPAYMSPEQATGKSVDARSDVFSFGVILYEMLTGRRPFGGATAMDTLVAIARDDAPSPSSIAPLPKTVERIVTTCLMKRAEGRFASGRELAGALDAFDSAQYSPLDLGSQPTELAGMLPSADQITRESMRRDVRKVGARVGLGLLGGVALCGALWVAAKTPRAPATPSTSAVAPHASAAAPAYAPKPEADALEQAGLSEDREGRHEQACLDLLRASDADPAWALAALRAMFCRGNDPRAGRPYFQRAWAGRAALDGPSAALVEGWEPIFQREPADERESIARLTESIKRFPGDARLHASIANLEYTLGSFDEAIPELEESLRIDPNQPHLLELYADSADYNGRMDLGDRIIDRCLRLVPTELGCIQERAWVESQRGQCEAVERDARRMLAIDPKFQDATQLLADAMYAQGSALEAVRTLLRRKREAASEADRKAAEVRDELGLAVLAGDLAGAEKLARTWAAEVAPSSVESEHGEVSAVLVALGIEMGKTVAASADASAYLDGRDGWDPNARFEDWAMSKEPTPRLLAVRLRAGTISQATFERERARTAQRWESRVVGHLRRFVWVWGYAAPTETPDEARVAMDALARYGGLPPFTPLTLVSADVGRTYLLAGKLDEAVAELEQATRECAAVDHPLEHTRAHYFLGQALEEKGDTAGACAAYRVVLDRWGSATPRSVTAEKAKQRAAALRCDAK